MRIVSLLPSTAEMVCVVGAGTELVGISHECDLPENIRDRTELTSARIHGARVEEIDRAVRNVIAISISCDLTFSI